MMRKCERVKLRTIAYILNMVIFYIRRGLNLLACCSFLVDLTFLSATCREIFTEIA